ncbi:TPA: 30S ribosomal protein S19e, partial [Candidatus Bathyarchaeota archaeon]|nr:30S ribosomal protein S19e [Candidatus Bathyarchaeota archaeon]
MPTVYDVPADLLISRVAKYLKENVDEVVAPAWAMFAKTGPHRERPPQNPDWWYVRCASLLRKLYIHGSLGVSRLRTEYGGRQRKGRSSEHSKKAGGSAIRKPLQQLERAGLVEKVDKEGRRLSREGIKLLDKVAAEILREIEE